MGAYEVLVEKEDARKGSPLCSFNGYLEDYLNTIDQDNPDYELLSKLLEKDSDLRIMVDLQMGISKESISNKIIRYKDIYKLDNRAVVIPYILYNKKNTAEKALLLSNDDYIYAKGMYYSLTEPGSELQNSKNDIVAIEKKDVDKVISVYEKIFTESAGKIQRDIDRQHFDNYDSAYEACLKLSEDIKEEVKANTNEEEKAELIRSATSRWFLIKKFAYVQFMIDKSILTERFQGDVHAQRNQAKKNADSIRFISISDMWRNNYGEENKDEIV